MTMHLTPEHQKWIAEQVAAGRFASMDEAVACAIANLMLDPTDDLEWVRPLIEQGEQSLANGLGISGDEFLKRLDHHLERLR